MWGMSSWLERVALPGRPEICELWSNVQPCRKSSWLLGQRTPEKWTLAF